MLTSLELRWLAKGDSLPYPKLVFCENFIESLGSYYPPFIGELMIEDKFYDCKNGLIIISTNKDLVLKDVTNLDIEIPHVLAHEYRHHWQQFNSKIIESECEDKYDNPWMNQIDYYVNCQTEMDALIFSQQKEFSNLDRMIIGAMNGTIDFEYMPEIKETERPKNEEEVYEIIWEDDESEEEENTMLDLISQYFDDHTIWNIVGKN